LLIPDPDPTIAPSRIRIPDPGGEKAPDPGSGSATLVQVRTICIINMEIIRRLSDSVSKVYTYRLLNDLFDDMFELLFQATFSSKKIQDPVPEH
jgi:hypothetical protein